MPYLKMDDDEFNIDELEDAEYDEDGGGQRQPYSGPKPRKGDILIGTVANAWWTFTQYNDRMAKVVFEATEESGKFEGCPIWDNVTFNDRGKFRWKPFIDANGISLMDIKKRTKVVDDDVPKLGNPLISWGKWKPGEFLVRVLVDYETDNNGDRRIIVGKWLPYDEDEYEEDEEEYDEEAEDEEVEEEEEEEAPPPRRSRSSNTSGVRSKKPSGAARASGGARPKKRPAVEEEAEEEKEATPRKPRRPATGTSSRAASKRPSGTARSKARAKPARRAKADDDGYDEEPPF